MGSNKTLRRVLSGTSDAAIRFDDLCTLLQGLGFTKRVRGSHHIFEKEGIDEMINIQRSGNQAIAYQVRQVRNIILKNRLAEGK